MRIAREAKRACRVVVSVDREDGATGRVTAIRLTNVGGPGMLIKVEEDQAPYLITNGHAIAITVDDE